MLNSCLSSLNGNISPIGRQKKRNLINYIRGEKRYSASIDNTVQIIKGKESEWKKD